MILELFKDRDREQKRIQNVYKFDTPHEAEDVYMEATYRYLLAPPFKETEAMPQKYLQILIRYAALNHMAMLKGNNTKQERLKTVTSHLSEGSDMEGSLEYRPEELLRIICKYYSKPEDVDLLSAILVEGRSIKSLSNKKIASKSRLYRLINDFKDKVMDEGDLHDLAIRSL